MQLLRIGLVGAGAFGRNHARKVSANPRAELAALFDPDLARAAALANEFGGTPVADLSALARSCTAAVIASPAGFHAEAALVLLRAGLHLLVEKPIATRLEDAEAMIEAARQAGVVLQVGHLERFQAAAGAIAEATGPVAYLEARREGPWQPRGTDVSVVLDLMIHDIDLALQMAGSMPERIEAVGTSVLAETTDVAQARLVFASGMTANLTASRVAPRVARVLKLWGEGGQVAVDLVGRRLRRIARGLPPQGGEPDGFGTEQRAWEATDALEAEHAAFLASVLDGAQVAVPGEAGRDALAVALAIEARIDEGDRRRRG